ncbi:MAG: hypothetical protein PF542_00095 [Nanoarchaeota archaeon]|jgi:hypothetical protein|nr:hypothetical protein [Nanoarchaeota archaeon]
MITESEHRNNYKEYLNFLKENPEKELENYKSELGITSNDIEKRKSTLEDKIFLAKSNKINSFSKNKTNPGYINNFLNESFEIIDYRYKLKEMESIGQKFNYHSSNEEKLNVKFDLENNTIYMERPKTKGQILNAIHSLELYYDLMIPLTIKDGYLKGNNISDSNKETQNIEIPRIEFLENIEASKKVYLDHPARVGDNNPEEKLLDVESFHNFNIGTNFMFINSQMNSLEKLLGDYSEFCKDKASFIVDFNQTEIKTFDLEWYLSTRPTEENFKTLKKINDSYNSLEIPDGLNKIIEFNNIPITSEDSFRDYINQIFRTYYIEEENLENANNWNSGLKEILLSHYKQFSEKDIEENQIAETRRRILEDVVKYIGPEKVELEKDYDYPSLIKNISISENWIDLFMEGSTFFTDFLERHETNLEKHKKTITNYITESIYNLKSELKHGKWKVEDIKEHLKYLENQEQSQETKEAIEHLKEEVDSYNKDFSLYRNLTKKIRKEKQKAKNQNILEENRKSQNTEIQFTKEEVLESFKEKSYFVIPMFIYYKRNKAFNHLNTTLDKFLIPSTKTESSTIIYDPKRGMNKQIIPNKVRNEFGINPPNPSFGENLTTFTRNEDEFAKIEKLL